MSDDSTGNITLSSGAIKFLETQQVAQGAKNQ